VHRVIQAEKLIHKRVTKTTGSPSNPNYAIPVEGNWNLHILDTECMLLKVLVQN